MSFARAKGRLAGAKRRRGAPEEALALDRQAGETLSTMKNLAINSSQFADDRPLSAIQVWRRWSWLSRLSLVVGVGVGWRGNCCSTLLLLLLLCYLLLLLAVADGWVVLSIS